jgi:hypothetical protein
VTFAVCSLAGWTAEVTTLCVRPSECCTEYNRRLFAVSPWRQRMGGEDISRELRPFFAVSD